MRERSFSCQRECYSSPLFVSGHGDRNRDTFAARLRPADLALQCLLKGGQRRSTQISGSTSLSEGPRNPHRRSRARLRAVTLSHCSRNARFSSCTYSRTSCWWRLTQPAKINIRNWSGNAFIDSIIRPNRSWELGRNRQAQRAARPWKCDGFCSADFSHTTGCSAGNTDSKTNFADLSCDEMQSRFDLSVCRTGIVWKHQMLIALPAYALR